MVLRAEALHFLGKDERERQYDCCLHGGIFLRIGETVLSDGTDRDWCVSASALRFLRTLFDAHAAGEQEQMIPCCGNMMIPSEDGARVTVIGCPNGVDFDVLPEGDEVRIRREGREWVVARSAYRSAVLAFVGTVWNFVRSAPPRRFYDDLDRDGFRAWEREMTALLDRASVPLRERRT